MSPEATSRSLDVLLVEDNPSDRWLYAEILESRGHATRPVENAEDAWEILQSERFPLILLDLGLPGSMDGLELCRRIRGLPDGDRPIILVFTGQTEPRTLDEVLEAGAGDYVEKPVDVALRGIRLAVAERSVRRQEERWAARMELQEASGRINALLRSLGDVFFSAELDPDRLLQVSSAAARVLGFRPEALKSEVWWQDLLLPAEARARLVTWDGTGTEDPAADAVLTHLYSIRHPGGEERWMQAAYHPTRDGSGRIRRVDGMVVDVSERHRTQVELAARNREVEGLARLSQRVLAAAATPVALTAALDEIRRATGFPVAVLERWAPAPGTLTVVAARGLDEGVAEELVGSVAPSESPSRVVVAGGAPRSFTDPRDFTHRIHPGLREPEPRVLVVFPLVAPVGTLGALTLLHTEPARPDGQLLRLGTTLATALATHLERMDAREGLIQRERSARALVEAVLRGLGTSLPEPLEGLEEGELQEVVRHAVERVQAEAEESGVRLRWAEDYPRALGHHEVLVQALAGLLRRAFQASRGVDPVEVGVRWELTDDRVRLLVETDGGSGDEGRGSADWIEIPALPRI